MTFFHSFLSDRLLLKALTYAFCLCGRKSIADITAAQATIFLTFIKRHRNFVFSSCERVIPWSDFKIKLRISIHRFKWASPPKQSIIPLWLIHAILESIDSTIYHNPPLLSIAHQLLLIEMINICDWNTVHARTQPFCFLTLDARYSFGNQVNNSEFTLNNFNGNGTCTWKQ